MSSTKLVDAPGPVVAPVRGGNSTKGLCRLRRFYAFLLARMPVNPFGPSERVARYGRAGFNIITPPAGGAPHITRLLTTALAGAALCLAQGVPASSEDFTDRVYLVHDEEDADDLHCGLSYTASRKVIEGALTEKGVYVEAAPHQALALYFSFTTLVWAEHDMCFTYVAMELLDYEERAVPGATDLLPASIVFCRKGVVLRSNPATLQSSVEEELTTSATSCADALSGGPDRPPVQTRDTTFAAHHGLLVARKRQPSPNPDAAGTAVSTTVVTEPPLILARQGSSTVYCRVQTARGSDIRVYHSALPDRPDTLQRFTAYVLRTFGQAAVIDKSCERERRIADAQTAADARDYHVVYVSAGDVF